MPSYEHGLFAKEEIAKRLRATRRALGYSNQQDFADQAGLLQSIYNQYENGKKRPSVDSALALCETYALTLDWIYRGDPSGLPHRLAVEIARDYNP